MKWRSAVGGALVALPMIALLGYGMTRDPKEIPSPLPGHAAPPFTLTAFTGSASTGHPAAVGLAELHGKVVVLNFWASWCLACRSEHFALQTVGSMYHDTADVRFFGVLYNDTPDNGRKWILEMGGESYPSLEDPGARTAIDYGLYGVPETFFIGRDGKVAFKQTGPVTEALLITKIEELRRQHPERTVAAGGSE